MWIGFNFYFFTNQVQLDRNSNSRKLVLEPSPRPEVVKKILCSIVCAAFFATFLSSFPVQRVKDEDFLEGRTALYQLGFLSIATVLIRFKYYHAWLFSDAVCNLSGLGFHGYNVDGTARWDLVTNVDILKFEFGLSLRESIQHWNKCTNTWLRLIVFERHNKYGTILTYTLSAFWHGFYPGYYLTFASGALFTFASRAIRRALRPLFLGTQAMKAFYDLITMLTTRVVMTYITFSFVVLEFWPSIRLFTHLYFAPHIMAAAAIIFLPKLCPAPSNKHTHMHSPLVNKISEFTSNQVTSGVHG
uniref:Uncharacterized protein n=1 Tax=Clastoptera arizonana TaxID=38151 RepID=A0A1B6C2P6_9HEMI